MTNHRFSFFVFHFLLFASYSLTGCITTRNEGLILKSRIASLERKAGRIETELPQIQEITKSNQKEISQIRKQQADLLNQFEELKQTIMALGGKLEESHNLPSRLGSLENQLKQQSDRLARLEEVIWPGRGEVDSKKLEPKWENEEVGYRDAYSTYKGGNFVLARAKFEKLLELYPNGQFTDNAHYWIGECFYAEKHYDRAILKFNEVISRYPKSPKTPSAYLKMGLAFLTLGKKKEARFAFETLIARFPKSEPAKIARKKMKKL